MLYDKYDNGESLDKIMDIPLLPLRDVVVFPHMIVPLFVGRERSIAALESAMKDEKGIFMVAQKSDWDHYSALAAPRRHGQGAGRREETGDHPRLPCQ
jgi:ATP-dependent Lon protease